MLMCAVWFVPIAMEPLEGYFVSFFLEKNLKKDNSVLQDTHCRFNGLLWMRSSQGFWGIGERGHIFQGNKGPKLRGTGEQRQFCGPGNIENHDFVLGSRGKRPFISGEQGNWYPPPGRAPWICVKQVKMYWSEENDTLFFSFKLYVRMNMCFLTKTEGNRR